MKNLLFMAFLLPAASVASAQQVAFAALPHPTAAGGGSTTVSTSIAAARQAGVGETVTVRGVISNGPELGQLRFIQDGAAGLATFSTTNTDLHALVPGDSVLLTGTLKNFNGLLEMDPVLNVKKLATGRPVPAVEVAFAELPGYFTEAYEGRVLRVRGVQKLTTAQGEPVSTLQGNTNYLLNGEHSLPLRIHQASGGAQGLIDKPLPTGQFDIIGHLSQFSQNGKGGYQLLPRLATDLLVADGLPVVKGEPVPTAIHRNGFTVSFQTLNPGMATVEYGPTPALGTAVSATEPATAHALELRNLEPGTVYYVRVSVSNAKGTSQTPAVPMITDGKKRPAGR